MSNNKIFLNIPITDFKCPNCDHQYSAGFYLDQLEKNNEGQIYKVCRYCRKKIGITTDYMGNVAVWMKADDKIVK